MSTNHEPGQGRYVQTAAKQKKARECPSCGSDRETTRKPMATLSGRPAGFCKDAWHDVEKSDGRIGTSSGASTSGAMTSGQGRSEGNGGDHPAGM